jgi:hypothetical protein
MHLPIPWHVHVVQKMPVTSAQPQVELRYEVLVIRDSSNGHHVHGFIWIGRMMGSCSDLAPTGLVSQCFLAHNVDATMRHGSFGVGLQHVACTSVDVVDHSGRIKAQHCICISGLLLQVHACSSKKFLADRLQSQTFYTMTL